MSLNSSAKESFLSSALGPEACVELPCTGGHGAGLRDLRSMRPLWGATETSFGMLSLLCRILWWYQVQVVLIILHRGNPYAWGSSTTVLAACSRVSMWSGQSCLQGHQAPWLIARAYPPSGVLWMLFKHHLIKMKLFNCLETLLPFFLHSQNFSWGWFRSTLFIIYCDTERNKPRRKLLNPLFVFLQRQSFFQSNP